MYYIFVRYQPLVWVAFASSSTGPAIAQEEIKLPRSEQHGNFACTLKIERWNKRGGGTGTKFLRYCEGPPIRNLVFSGGGAKGVAYAGVVSALEEFQVSEGVSVRDQIESVAGSSAGAITAAFVAVGVSANELIQESREKDLSELLDSTKSFIPRFVGKSGMPLYEWIRDTIKRKVCEFALTVHVRDNPGLARIRDKCSNTHMVPPPITFGDLQVLHGISPRQFKRLAVVSTDATTGRKIVFSWETFPDFEIALACRASASIPAIILPVVVPGSMLGVAGTQPTVLLVDGGLIDNVPIEQATDPSRRLIRGYDAGKEGQDLSTLVFVFDESGESVSPFTQIHDSYAGRAYNPKFADVLVRDHVIKNWIQAPIHNTVTKFKRLEDVRKRYTLRNVGIRVDGVKTTDFGKAKKLAPQLIENGKRQTLEYLEIHGRVEWVHESYDSAAELVNDLPEPKFQQLVAMGVDEVFGAPLRRTDWEVLGTQDSSNESCSYTFERGGRHVERSFPCLDDGEFLQTVLGNHSSRRRISDFPTLSGKWNNDKYMFVLGCFEESLVGVNGAKIGEYVTSYKRLSKLMDIHPVVPSEAKTTGDRRMVRFKDSLVFSYSRAAARVVCEKIDAVGFWDLERR